MLKVRCPWLNTRLAALLVFAGACGACSGGEGSVHSDSPAPLAAVDTSTPDASELSEPEPCGMAFDPVPSLLEATRVAAARWSAATGCDVRVEAGGVPIVLWPSMRGTYDDRGVLSIDPTVGRHRMCGATNLGVEIIVAPCSAPIEFSVFHEMGHELAGSLEHSASGALAAGTKASEDVIDAGSLAVVCAGFACAVVRPEAADQ